MLLTREQFREQVFARDAHKCVFCHLPAIDAHHIIERRLFSDGGYYLSNGAAVCSDCHIKCETTEYSVEQVREACKITKPILPDHLYDDQIYDKWGNVILPNGTRLKGEMFYDVSVQKVLNQYLHLFVDYVKYPRTYHLPWSPGITKDDRVHDYTELNKNWTGHEVVITEKMDGENTTMYCDYIHARSINGKNHPSRDWVKGFHSQIKHDIPKGWRICGENLYALHSIHYYDLPTYFLGFSVWNDKNICLSWDETLYWFELLGIVPVPYCTNWTSQTYTPRFIWDESKIKTLPFQKKLRDGATSRHEGYVIRHTSEISYGDFRHKVGKYVRENHIQTDEHWFFGRSLIKNELHTLDKPAYCRYNDA